MYRDLRETCRDKRLLNTCPVCGAHRKPDGCPSCGLPRGADAETFRATWKAKGTK